MTLREKQTVFTRLAAALILRAYDLGYEVTLGEAYRSPEEAERLAKLGKGIRKSLHTLRLAIDLNLFRDGAYLTSIDGHEPLGTWWEAQSADAVTCSWGGRFGDPNHYSVAHGGRR